MEFIETKLPGVIRLKPKVFKDTRGFFLDYHHEEVFAKAGITARFVQDSHSYSQERGVIRGMHFQLPPSTQAKIVRVIRGAVFDVVLDLRVGSPTFGKWASFELSAENFEMLFIPRGLAHGFCTTVAQTEMLYKLDNLYAPTLESGVRWDDPELAIPWPTSQATISLKDAEHLRLSEIKSPFVFDN
ncbi:MAG: dTDP-4-dehydrorhamnose 3,5-epimerase [Spirochaetia bacterium]|nr:dTDP-4-dehydrorhamnose 3,5-epimerase [Spirochaetia bacterium]